MLRTGIAQDHSIFTFTFQRQSKLCDFKGLSKNELKSGLMVYVCNSQLNERLKQNHFKLKGSPCHRVKSSPE